MKKSEQLTEEELLELLMYMTNHTLSYWHSNMVKQTRGKTEISNETHRVQQAYEQLREMIHRKPCVSREWVEALMEEVTRYFDTTEGLDIQRNYHDEMYSQVVRKLEKIVEVEE